MHNKKLLREQFSLLREKCTKEQNDALINNLMNIPEYKNAKCVFTYISVKTEPDTEEFISKSIEMGKTVCVPKCTPKTRTMKFIEITSLKKDLIKGAYNIPEPVSDIEFEGVPDLMVIPALSCDLRGIRLGYGGGYYDRFLANIKGAVKAAIIYDCLLTEELPCEPTDIPVDIIITESRILRLR